VTRICMALLHVGVYVVDTRGLACTYGDTREVR
jgi:hypothetical protein